MIPGPWRVGIYLESRIVLEHPDYVRRLRDEIGLDTVVLSFTGELPRHVLTRSPFPNRPPSDPELDGLVIRHLDGRPVDPSEYERARTMAGPGVPAGGQDRAFVKAIGKLKDLGLAVWLGGATWTIRRLMFCPSREEVQGWFEAVCAHWASSYDVDGLDLTHFRYPMGSFPLGLFGCTCAACRAAARDLGYDMDRMVADLKAAREGLRRLDGGRLGAIAREGLGFFDVVHGLGLGAGVVDWFRFRCDLMTQSVARVRAAVREAAPGKTFGTDTYPASLAFTAGHDHLRWAEMADFASPLLSHISALLCDTFIGWTRFLLEEIPSLPEGDALRLVYRFTGYDGLGLPDTIAGFTAGEPAPLAFRIPTADLVIRDLVKARLFLPAEMPSYPVIHGEGWPRATIDRIAAEARRLGHQGIIWQGTGALMPYPLGAG